MNNIDTIAFSLNFRKKKTSIITNKKSSLNWPYISNMSSKIISKLNLYENDKKTRQHFEQIIKSNTYTEFLFHLSKQKRKIYYWHGKSNGLIFTYNEIWQNLTITVSHEIIGPRTKIELENYVLNEVITFFNISNNNLPTLNISRIDVKNDFKYHNIEEFEIIKNIIEKANNKIYSYKKNTLRNDDNGYVVKYIYEKAKYKKTLENSYKVYENTGNFEEIILYNKELEIKEKIENGKLPQEYLQIYESIFRTEVRTKNKKLNSNFYKGFTESKSLGVYYSIKGSSNLYNTIISKIFSNETFYRIDIAIKIIKASNSLNTSTKNKLISLLKTINLLGYSKAQKLWKKSYKRSTFYNHIKTIKYKA